MSQEQLEQVGLIYTWLDHKDELRSEVVFSTGALIAVYAYANDSLQLYKGYAGHFVKWCKERNIKITACVINVDKHALINANKGDIIPSEIKAV